MVTKYIEFDTDNDLTFLFGDLQRSLKLIEENFGLSLSIRGSKVLLQGEGPSVEKAVSFINELNNIRHDGYSTRPEEIRHVLRGLSSGGNVSLTELFSSNIAVSPKKGLVTPKTKNQMDYINAIRKYDMVFSIGPAGTGKTYLAMAMAVNALLGKQVSRVVLARPAVEAGERLGFLPGDMQEKVIPYLRPLYDALFDMLEVEKANRLIERGVIEIAPLAFMRGRTLNDSFVILDEAQNTTNEQMKMYLTRLGFNSKTVITGDVTQIDLPPDKRSGLVEAVKIMGKVRGIKVVYFSERDVVRHKLVQKIVKAYDRYERKQKDINAQDQS
jgi:phosphate starvation-inducible PhoH-like protein